MEEKRKQLLEYHGIGPKVADCIMLFGCREFTAFPVDTWVKTIMNDMYGFEKKDIKGMQAFARERFGDLRGFAQQYLFPQRLICIRDSGHISIVGGFYIVHIRDC